MSERVQGARRRLQRVRLWTHSDATLRCADLQVESLKQDLAHALYKEDAAARVIARLIKEKEAAQKSVFQRAHNAAACLNSYFASAH